VVNDTLGFITKAIPIGGAWEGGTAFDAPVGFVTDRPQFPPLPANDYGPQYLAWFFKDSTQADALRYGWAEISLSVGTFAAGGPTVTIWGYAYDDTGLKPTMGQQVVPEPASGALLVMGAMALGARGLRKWRQGCSR
jgi:hypothetical protein